MEATIEGDVRASREVAIWGGLEDLRDVLRMFLVRHCADEHEVEDVIQETYLRAVRYRGRLKEGGRLRSWTMRIAMNVLADRRRRERRYVEPVEEELEPVAPECAAVGQAALRVGRFELEADEALGLMKRVLGTLRASDRRLLGSFYGGEESCRSTARECDLAPELVKVRLFRARRRLCRAMRHRVALERAGRVATEAAEPTGGSR